MSRAQNEPISIQPLRIRGMVLQCMSVEHRANFCAPERQTQMSTGTGVNGIHGEATRFIGGAAQGGKIE